MFKRICMIVLVILFVVITNNNLFLVSADEKLFVADTDIYTIYDQDFNVLFQKDIVEIGDNYLSKDYKFYEIVYIDNENKVALAKFVKDVEKPNVSKSNLPRPIEIEKRVICMYMTHNDESYVPTDGVDSIYGNGGIRDVANAFRNELEKKMVTVYFDDSLHIPHDTSAYSRSQKTAKKLYDTYNPDAIFDIHRDGTSRKFYVSDVNGKERGRVRMVIGKSNSNMALNEEFALYLMAVGNELYPWLFTDIYYGKGHYNQGIDSKAILFEMGSHLVEKELMIESMKELADVVTTAMYKTTVNEETGDLTVGGVETEKEITINKVMDKKQDYGIGILVVSIIVVVFASISVYVIYYFYKNTKKSKI